MVMNEFHERPVHIQEEALYLQGGAVDGSCMIPVLAFKLSRLHDTFFYISVIFRCTPHLRENVSTNKNISFFVN